MPSRQCLKCGRLTRRSYCARCAKQRQLLKVQQRPWLALYALPEWRQVKWRVHRRDGYRCRYTDGRGRCRSDRHTSTIEAHHVIKVSALYLRAGRNWQTFLRLALDPSNIVTLCYRHHKLADSRPRLSQQAVFSADRKRLRARR